MKWINIWISVWSELIYEISIVTPKCYFWYINVIWNSKPLQFHGIPQNQHAKLLQWQEKRPFLNHHINMQRKYQVIRIDPLLRVTKISPIGPNNKHVINIKQCISDCKKVNIYSLLMEFLIPCLPSQPQLCIHGGNDSGGEEELPWVSPAFCVSLPLK